MAQHEAEQQLRDVLLLFQQHVQQTLDPAHSPHLSASQRNHVRHVAQHVFHHLAGPVRKTVSPQLASDQLQRIACAVSPSFVLRPSTLQCYLCACRHQPHTNTDLDVWAFCLFLLQWLNALDTHLASINSVPATTSSPPPSTSPLALQPDLATAQLALAQHHSRVTNTLQHALDTIRTTNLHLIPENTTDVPTTTTTATATTPPTAGHSGGRAGAVVLEEDEASRVVEARAEVDNVVDEVNELLKKERLEWTELHTFLASHPLQRDSGGGASADVAAGVDRAGVAVGGGAEVSKASVGAVGGSVSSGGSPSGSQLSSPSSGHSKQVAAGLAKRLNRSSAM